MKCCPQIPLLALLLAAIAALTACSYPVPNDAPGCSTSEILTLSAPVPPSAALTATAAADSNAAAVIPTAVALHSSPVNGPAFAFATRDGELWISGDKVDNERMLGINGQHFAWSPDGQWIAVMQSQALWIISPEGNARRQLVSLAPTAGSLYHLAWSPDSSRIAYVAATSPYSPTITTLNMVELHSLTTTKWMSTTIGPPFALIWSSGGDSIAWAPMSHWGTISTVSLNTGDARTIDYRGDCGGVLDELSWSPDGKRIAHLHWGQGASGGWICITNLEDGATALLNVGGHASTPLWDSQGRFLYIRASDIVHSDTFVSDDPRLLRYDVMGHSFERLASFDQSVRGTRRTITMSPDGKRIAHLGVYAYPSGTVYEEFDLLQASMQSHHVSENVISSWRQEYVWLDNAHILVMVLQNEYPHDGILFSLDVITGAMMPVTGPHPLSPIHLWLSKYGVTN